MVVAVVLGAAATATSAQAALVAHRISGIPARCFPVARSTPLITRDQTLFLWCGHNRSNHLLVRIPKRGSVKVTTIKRLGPKDVAEGLYAAPGDSNAAVFMRTDRRILRYRTGEPVVTVASVTSGRIGQITPTGGDAFWYAASVQGKAQLRHVSGSNQDVTFTLPVFRGHRTSTYLDGDLIAAPDGSIWYGSLWTFGRVDLTGRLAVERAKPNPGNIEYKPCYVDAAGDLVASARFMHQLAFVSPSAVSLTSWRTRGPRIPGCPALASDGSYWFATDKVYRATRAGLQSITVPQRYRGMTVSGKDGLEIQPFRGPNNAMWATTDKGLLLEFSATGKVRAHKVRGFTRFGSYAPLASSTTMYGQGAVVGDLVKQDLYRIDF